MIWKPTVHKYAVKDLDYVRDNHPTIFKALLNTIDMLVMEDNPVRPTNPDLNICRLRNMPPWARGKIKRTCRFVFRLLQSVDGEPLREIYDFEIEADAETKILQLVMVTPRDSHTYDRVAARQEMITQ